MITLENLQVVFNPGTALEVNALKGINLQIPEGQFVTVIGSNGAGKSTLLSTLTGEVRPLIGHMVIGDQEVTRWSTARRAKLVARVFQDPMIGTCANLTIEENMALANCRGRRRGLRLALNNSLREEFRNHLAELNLGLEDRLHDPMGSLSGGQRQAVSLLMAVLRPMKILVLDEHTAALDPKTADFVLDVTKKIVAERNLTVMMVTHSMHQALDVGDRTIMLHEGKIIFDVDGNKRKKLKIEDLLKLFKKASGMEVDNDALLLE